MVPIIVEHRLKCAFLQLLVFDDLNRQYVAYVQLSRQYYHKKCSKPVHRERTRFTSQRFTDFPLQQANLTDVLRKLQNLLQMLLELTLVFLIRPTAYCSDFQHYIKSPL